MIVLLEARRWELGRRTFREYYSGPDGGEAKVFWVTFTRYATSFWGYTDQYGSILAKRFQ